MMYYLVSKNSNIKDVYATYISNDFEEAYNYFLITKDLPKEKFDNLFVVLNSEQYIDLLTLENGI